MSDRERVLGLRRHFPLSAIAGILGTDRSTVHAVERGEASLPAGGGGSGALVVEAPAEVQLAAVSPADPNDWHLAGFLALGPIQLEGRPYLVTWRAQAIGDDVAGDLVGFSGLTVEPGDVEGPFGGSGAPVAADWPTAMWAPAGHVQMYTVIYPDTETDLYFLMAASDSSGAAAPSAPVTVRNRHLSALPL